VGIDVFVRNVISSGQLFGVPQMAVGYTAKSLDNNGVVGISTNKDGHGIASFMFDAAGPLQAPIDVAGIYGENVAEGGIGVVGRGSAAGVVGIGMYGVIAISRKEYGLPALLATASQGEMAAQFNGHVQVIGDFLPYEGGVAASFRGDVQVTGNFRAVEGGLAASFQGDVQVAGNIRGDMNVTGDIILTNQDCAEDFDVAHGAAAEPGTVMVLDDNGSLTESNRPYDKRVAGVIAGAADCKPAITLGRQSAKTKREPLSLVGKAYCKVDASYAPIKVGDLLTSSATPGHAMKAVDPTQAFGAVIGKALRPLASGEGLIPILIALQ
jgi:hypothetical protein